MRLSYQNRLFILLLVFAVAVVSSFVVFQYDREKAYKASSLNELLQLYNRQILDALEDSADIATFLAEHRGPIAGLRVTVLDTCGTMLFDNILDTSAAANHRDRPEIAEAIREGSAYTVRRHSESTNDNYFYSALSEGGLVVRTAAPYTVSLSQVLKADNSFLSFMGGVTVVMVLLAWLATRQIGRTITRLNNFAAKAENGDKIYDDEAFPRDELGEISQHIVSLYAQRERQHEEALRQEQDKMRVKKQLTNNINHELKTPLAAMQVCLETLLSHPDLDEDKRQLFIRRCWDNSERLKSLLVDVSTLTRLDDGRDMIATETVVLDAVVRNAVENYSGEGRIPVDVDIEKELTMSGNISLISAIFSNLLSNANNYSRGTKITIRASRNDAGEITVTFADDGIGIPEEHLPYIFERFYRIDKGRSRATGGTGLGLSIVKNAVQFHGGTITVENAPTGGLLFVMRFGRNKDASR